MQTSKSPGQKEKLVEGFPFLVRCSVSYASVHRLGAKSLARQTTGSDSNSRKIVLGDSSRVSAHWNDVTSITRGAKYV